MSNGNLKQIHDTKRDTDRAPAHQRSHMNKGRRERNVRDRVNVVHEITNNLCDRQLAPKTRDIGLRLSCEKGFNQIILSENFSDQQK